MLRRRSSARAWYIFARQAAPRLAACPGVRGAAPAAPIAQPASRPTAPSSRTNPAMVGSLAIPVAAAEEPPPDVAEVAMKGAPPFLVSMVVHMVLIIVLALI